MQAPWADNPKPVANSSFPSRDPIILYGLMGPSGLLAGNISGQPFLEVEKRAAENLVRTTYLGHQVVPVELVVRSQRE